MVWTFYRTVIPMTMTTNHSANRLADENGYVTVTATVPSEESGVYDEVDASAAKKRPLSENEDGNET